jgi:hypothetical protein
MRRPHPFFWLTLALVSGGALASALTDTRSPSWALHSAFIYHVEVGAAVALAGYLVAVTLWLASRGRTFAKVELPIGSVETADAGALDEAADEFDAFRTTTADRLDALEGSVADLRDLIVELVERGR